MNLTLGSIKSTISAILAKELAPHVSSQSFPVKVAIPHVHPQVSSPACATIASHETLPTMPTVQGASPVSLNFKTPQITTPSDSMTLSSTFATSTNSSPMSAELSETQLAVTEESNEFDALLLESGPISVTDLTGIFNKSCSRRNFSTNMVRHLFTKEERMQSNVNGRGKNMLDPNLMRYVKDKSFQFFPISGSEKLADKWSECIIAIDEANRRLKNKPSKKLSIGTS